MNYQAPITLVHRADETREQFMRRTQSADTSGVPEWVHAGRYADNTPGLKIAVMRWHLQKSTLKERALSAAYAASPKPPTYACSSCGKHAFHEPTVCFTCRRRS